MRTLLVLTAFCEAATGLAVLVEPALVARLLLGAEVAGIGLVISRVAGTALVAIATMCWLARHESYGVALRGLLAGVLVYDVAVAAVLAHAGLGLSSSGILLWSAVVAHGGLGCWCAICLTSFPERNAQAPIPGEPSLGRTPTMRPTAPSRYSAAQFLIALILLLCVSPVLEESATGEILEGILLTIVLIAAIPAVGGRRRTVLIASLLALPAISGKWLHHFHPDVFRHEWFLAAAIVFALFVVGHHLGFILRSAKVDQQVLCAGVSAFLMLGLLWTFGYLLLNGLSPGAIMMELEPEAHRPLHGFGAMYFSFATLSGAYCPEITATSNLARMLALLEGMTAMFYVAILIARLVALYSEESADE